MGIVNITPDRFSDSGRFFTVDNAVEHALKLVRSGAGILDLGEESTRPDGSGWKTQYEYAWLALQRAVKRYPYPAYLVRKRKAVINFKLGKCDIAERKYISGLFALYLPVYSTRSEQ
ncbi:MAG: dihydropteroate synthase [Planctomycetaceae bacterium]|jgi:dihydropteroate synthase|nr:dihydropteroate synthase [Planctomycetaceae bacterium]